MDKITCAEVDPMVVGDACVLELGNDGGELALVLDFDAFQEQYETDVGHYEGKGFVVKMEKLEEPKAKYERMIREELEIYRDVPVKMADLADIQLVQDDGDLF